MIVPDTVIEVLKLVETTANTELKPKFTVINMSNLFGLTTSLTATFTKGKCNVPQPTEDELKTIVKGVKETLENPEKYGFVVRNHVNSMDSISEYIQVDWSVPVVPVEPVKPVEPEETKETKETNDQNNDNIEPETPGKKDE